ncbi:MAG: hypothetical protein ACO3TI_06960, partial [Aquiluna sp.]
MPAATLWSRRPLRVALVVQRTELLQQCPIEVVVAPHHQLWVDGAVLVGGIGVDVTPFAAPVPMRAGGLVRPLSIAGGLPGAYAPGEPNAVCRRCTRFGA